MNFVEISTRCYLSTWSKSEYWCSTTRKIRRGLCSDLNKVRLLLNNSPLLNWMTKPSVVFKNKRLVGKWQNDLRPTIRCFISEILFTPAWWGWGTHSDCVCVCLVGWEVFFFLVCFLKQQNCVLVWVFKINTRKWNSNLIQLNVIYTAPNRNILNAVPTCSDSGLC